MASDDDLLQLFDTLKKFKDINGNHPVLTANTIVANPDFEKIKASDFNEYHYEPFTETLKKYPNHKGAFQLWQQGMSEGLFKPQFHGREHLNVHRWMQSLRDGMPETHFAFEHEVFGLSVNITSEKRKSYMAALDFDSSAEIENQKSILEDGLDLFESSLWV